MGITSHNKNLTALFLGPAIIPAFAKKTGTEIKLF